MKRILIFMIILSVFAIPANAQPKNDSIELKTNLKKLDKAISEVKVLNYKLEKKEKSFYEKLIFFFSHFGKHKYIQDPYLESPARQDSLLKPDSDAVYCEDCYTEVVERSFIGKLFGGSKYRIRKYRYENNKKIYLD